MEPLSLETQTGIEEAPPVPGGTPAKCKQHPDVVSAYLCKLCATPVCQTCAFPEPNGTALCPECKVKEAVLLPLIESTLPLSEPAAIVIPPDTRCRQHPNVAATQQCKLCESYMCATCDFDLPDGIHICPTCAAAPRSPLGAKGKNFLIWSFATAIWSTIGLSALVSGALGGLAETKADQTVLGWILIIFVLAPAVTGLSLAISAKRPRRATPASLWIVLVWNSIIIGCFLLLSIIGMMK